MIHLKPNSSAAQYAYLPIQQAAKYVASPTGIYAWKLTRRGGSETHWFYPPATPDNDRYTRFSLVTNLIGPLSCRVEGGGTYDLEVYQSTTISAAEGTEAIQGVLLRVTVIFTDTPAHMYGDDENQPIDYYYE